MSRLSLPEERLLEGKGQGSHVEPVVLDIDDDELHRLREKARTIVTQGGRFTSEDLHRIVARSLLGI